MNTPKDGRKLSRTSAHRLATLRSMSLSLFKYDKIETTYAKAKETESFASKLIHIAKNDTVTARRKVFQHIKDKTVLDKLFNTIAKKYTDRAGGYVKVIKSGRRLSDGASMAILKLV